MFDIWLCLTSFITVMYKYVCPASHPGWYLAITLPPRSVATFTSSFFILGVSVAKQSHTCTLDVPSLSWQFDSSCSARSEATTPLSLFPPCVFPFLSRAGALEKTLLPSRNTVFWVVIFHLEPPIPSYNGEYQHTSGQQTPTKPSPRLSHKTKRTFDLIWIVFNSRVPFFLNTRLSS